MYYEVVYWSRYAVILSILIIQFKTKKPLPSSLKYLMFLLISHFVFQLPAPYILEKFGSNSKYYKIVLLIYMMIEWGLFKNLFESKKNKKVVSFLFLIGFLAVLIEYAFAFSDITRFSQVVLYKNLVVLASSLLFYWEMLNDVSIVSIYSQWKFVLVSGFFFHALVISGSRMVIVIAFAYGISKYNLWPISSTVYLIQLLILLSAVYVYDKGKKIA